MLLARSERNGAFAATLGWLGAQTMETACVDGLLVIQRAQRIRPDWPLPDARELRAAVRYPSLLSEMVLANLFEDEFRPALPTMHGPKAETDLRPDPYFQKHRQSLVAVAHAMEATAVDEKCGGVFSRQWQAEWDAVVRRSGVPKDETIISVWGGSRSSTRLARESLMGDALRSAWLRALAWACEADVLEPHKCLELSNWVAPLDIDLWGTRHSQRPAEWPLGDSEVPLSGLDLQALRDAAFSATVPVYAIGSVDEAASRELELIAFLSHRAQFDDLGELREDLSRATGFTDTLRLGSTTTWRVFSNCGDLLPLAARCHPQASNRYQFARLARGLWAPACGPETILRSTCRRADVVFERGESTVGRWSDWIDRTDLDSQRGRRSHGGVQLRMPREVIAPLEKTYGPLRFLVTLQSMDESDFKQPSPPEYALWT